MRSRALVVAAVVAAAVLGSGNRTGDAAAAADDKPAPSISATDGPPVVILKSAGSRGWGWAEVDSATTWRTYEVWQTDVARLNDGKTVAVNPFDYRFAGGWRGNPNQTTTIREATGRMGSPLPPTDWREPDFDDGAWLRASVPMRWHYRSTALICLRGKFEVTDPAHAPDLTLRLGFQGGVVAYLNGREVHRAFLPDGEIRPDTPAHAYPLDAYVGADGKLLNVYPTWSVEQAKRDPWLKDEDVKARFATRFRTSEATVAARLLRKGVNVVAIEVHRAPANETMFTNPNNRGGGDTTGWFYGRQGLWWNRCQIDAIHLLAPAGTAVVVPNYGRRKGFRVEEWSVCQRPWPVSCADPCETLHPIRLYGLRNGAYAAQVVVSSREAIRGIRAAASDLTEKGGGRIPASAVEIGYALYPRESRGTAWWGWQYDALDDVPPDEVPVVSQWTLQYKFPLGDLAGAVQPIWVTVKVPRDARPGPYRGELTVAAEGQEPVKAPIELNVVGRWVLPDARDFRAHMGILQSPDSVARYYGVKLWSEEHWKMLDRTFELLARVADRDVFIPVITRTQLGNDQTMVRWVRQADGTHQLDFSIAERYLDTALKHLGKVPIVALYLHDTTLAEQYGGSARTQVHVTEWDPATGGAKDVPAPAWGTPESLAFWKPVIDGMRDILSRRGLDGSLAFAYSCNGTAIRGQLDDLKKLAPQAKWLNCTHMDFQTKLGDPKAAECNVIELSCVMNGVLHVFQDPDTEETSYGWRANDPVLQLAKPRGKASALMTQHAEWSLYRICVEGTFLNWGRPLRGIGHLGGDFWPVLPDNRGGYKTLNERDTYWSSLTLSQVILSLTGPGRNLPVPTPRLQMLRESLQEAEARIFVQDALLDRAAQLGPDLAKRCKQLCDDRTRLLRYCSAYFGDNGCQYGAAFSYDRWQKESVKLYELADEVAGALGK